MASITIKQFNSRVGKLTASNTKFKNEVQELLCIAAQYAFDDKNVSPLTSLVMRGSEFRFDGIDHKTLIHWIEEHTPARWDNKECKFRFNKAFQGVYDAVTLLAEPWWKKQTPPTRIVSSVDALAEVRSLIARLEKLAAKKVVVDGVETAVEIKHGDLMDKLKAIANEVEFAEGEQA